MNEVIEKPPTVDQKVGEVIARLKSLAQTYGPIAFATSLGAEDMVLLDLIARHAPEIEVFTLDTGRLPPETYKLLQEIEQRYRIKVRVYYPNTAALETHVRVNGISGFYDSMAQRKDCCAVRKVEPLGRALADKQAWLTGLRREQAESRQALAYEELDARHCIPKFNPLVDWTLAEVWAYLRQHGVPYNRLHDRGYPSIGCAPCTRAVQPGEDIRAGRWWWERGCKQECGLHVNDEKQVLVREIVAVTTEA
jgi:phosphoadenosine phosphosulfate reductase